MENLDQLTPEALAKMSPDELKALCMQLIAAVKQPAASDAEAELAEAKKKLGEMEAKCAALEGDKKMAEKKSAFAKLLSEGKAVAAQEQAYLAGDMIKFAELSAPVSLAPQGHGETPAPAAGSKDAVTEVSELAKAKRAANPKLSVEDSISIVLSEKPELAKQIYN